MVQCELFGKHNGKDVILFTVSNNRGNIMKLINYGARLIHAGYIDYRGQHENVVLSYDTFKEIVKGHYSFGAVIGRYANRIAGGKFTIDGIEYQLPVNDGKNTLHGGDKGWHSVVWDEDVVESSEGNAVQFSYLSPHMEQGFPGNVKVQVKYTLTDMNDVIIDYTWETDRLTHVNITNHTYFNLNGNGKGDILNHSLRINSTQFLPVNEDMIPTGEIKNTYKTPFYFRKHRNIGEHINSNNEQLRIAGGYDHTYVLKKDGNASLGISHGDRGRILFITTDQPGLHVYTGNFLDGSQMREGGKSFKHRSGICLETGRYPDSPNHPEFPSTLAEPGKIYKSRTEYCLARF